VSTRVACCVAGGHRTKPCLASHNAAAYRRSDSRPDIDTPALTPEQLRGTGCSRDEGPEAVFGNSGRLRFKFLYHISQLLNVRRHVDQVLAEDSNLSIDSTKASRGLGAKLIGARVDLLV
jgi:hypothetical protein